MLSNSLELSGMAVPHASDLLQTGCKQLILITGIQGQEHSGCTQGSHCLTLLLVKVRSLTGLDNYMPIKRNSHYA